MNVEVLTLAGPLFIGTAKQVQVVTLGGEETILPHHELATAIMVPGSLVVTPSSGSARKYDVLGGVVDITSDGVKVLAQVTKLAVDIDKLSENATQTAKLLSAATDHKQRLAEGTAVADHSSHRIGVAGLRRRKRR